MTLGGGAMSRKQHVNTKSSTEEELVGVDEALPQILWARYSLEELRYTIKSNILYHNSQSAMIMETHVKTIHSKRTTHIKVRYFYQGSDQPKRNRTEVLSN